jgi:hypothetical protein
VSGATHLEHRIAAMSRDATPVSLGRRVTYALVVTASVLFALVLRAPELPRALTPAGGDAPAPSLVGPPTFVPLRYDARGHGVAARATTVGRVVRILVERRSAVR